MLVAPLWLLLSVAVLSGASDLRLLQSPRGRGNYRQDAEEGQDHQVELIHR